eukprot:4017926-Amphidinium_carterae.1
MCFPKTERNNCSYSTTYGHINAARSRLISPLSAPTQTQTAVHQGWALRALTWHNVHSAPPPGLCLSLRTHLQSLLCQELWHSDSFLDSQHNSHVEMEGVPLVKWEHGISATRKMQNLVRNASSSGIYRAHTLPSVPSGRNCATEKLFLLDGRPLLRKWHSLNDASHTDQHTIESSAQVLTHLRVSILPQLPLRSLPPPRSKPK